jgi:hypothetical protein
MEVEFIRRNRYGLLLVLLVATFLINGVEASQVVRIFNSVMVLGSLAVAFLGARSGRGRLRLMALIPVSVIGIVLLSTASITGPAGAIGATAQVIVLSGVAISVASDVMTDERVTNQTLLGAISAYFLIGQIFAWVYLSLPGYLDDEVISPAGGAGFTDYYSYVVLTTLGFGDVTPVGALAQRVTVLEALIGQMFLAILIGRLVALYSRQSAPSESADS